MLQSNKTRKCLIIRTPFCSVIRRCQYGMLQQMLAGVPPGKIYHGHRKSAKNCWRRAGYDIDQLEFIMIEPIRLKGQVGFFKSKIKPFVSGASHFNGGFGILG